MTRTTKLEALLAKVEAGTCSNDGIMYRSFGDDWTHCFDAYNGSLDAAKALHDAVLPRDMCPSLDAILRPNGDVEWRVIIHQQGLYYPDIPERVYVECGSDVPWNDPARAWLFAIIEMLIKLESEA